MKSSNTFLLNINRLYGVQYPHSRNYWRHGSGSGTCQSMYSTRLPSRRHSTRLVSTIERWTTNRSMCLCWVRSNIFQFTLMLLMYLRFFIHTTNSNTSRSLGEDRRNKNKSAQLETPVPGIGMTRPWRSWRGLWKTIGRLTTPPPPHIYQLSPHQALPLSQYQDSKALTVMPLLWNLSLTSIVVCSFQRQHSTTTLAGLRNCGDTSRSYLTSQRIWTLFTGGRYVCGHLYHIFN